MENTSVADGENENENEVVGCRREEVVGMSLAKRSECRLPGSRKLMLECGLQYFEMLLEFRLPGSCLAAKKRLNGC